MIWNLPDRADMMRTVRHEGFHQYLDRVIPDAPDWLNEGLAEYFEAARLENGTWMPADRHPLHLETLSQNSTTPLPAFLFGSYEEFHAKPRLHYAQAWAFVTLLRHSTPENKQIFQKLWTALHDQGAHGALTLAFPESDLGRLERELAVWLRARK
jgi:hypothetical protein